MVEISGELSTINKPLSGEIKSTVLPEAREKETKPHTDLMILFGQGPIKPVLLQEELTKDQQSEWENFIKDPLHNIEPEFRVIQAKGSKIDSQTGEAVETNVYLQTIEDIRKRTDITEGEKNELITKERIEWQNNPRFALNRYGRTIALTGGVALVEGLTDKLIICGGKTMPKWALPNGNNPLQSELVEAWPTEAALIKKQIVMRFGELYKEKTGKDIEDAIFTEDGSSTTVYNFANALEQYKEILNSSNTIGLVAADFHLQRVAKLSEFMLGDIDVPQEPVPAQETLQKRAVDRGKKKYQDMLSYIRGELGNNPEIIQRLAKEERLIRELVDPRVLGSWTITGKISPELQDVIVRFLNRQWIAEAKPVFDKAGLNIDSFTSEDIENLKRERPNDYDTLRTGLSEVNSDPRFKSGWSQSGIHAKVNK